MIIGLSIYRYYAFFNYNLEERDKEFHGAFFIIVLLRTPCLLRTPFLKPSPWTPSSSLVSISLVSVHSLTSKVIRGIHS